MGEERNRFLSSETSRRSSGSVFLVLFLIALGICPRDLRGVAVALYQLPRERSIGADPTDAVILRGAPSGPPRTRWCVEAGEWLLFGIDGLRIHSLAVELVDASGELRVSAARLDTPVGRESSFEADLTVPAGDRIRLGTSVRWDRAALDGCRDASLVSLSVSAFLRVAGRVALVTRGMNIRLAGEGLPGAAASLGVVLSPESPLCAVARLDLTSAGEPSFRVASRVWLGRSVLLSAGYCDDTGSIDGSVWIRVGDVALDAGSRFHPSLGVSHGLFVSWGRGW